MNPNVVFGVQMAFSILGLAIVVWLIIALYSISKMYRDVYEGTTDPDPVMYRVSRLEAPELWPDPPGLPRIPADQLPPMPRVKPPKPEPEVIPEQNGRGLIIFKGNQCT